MIGIDTNILVRYVTEDDPKQAALAQRLIEDEISAAEPGYIALTVIVELNWVLGKLYQVSDEEMQQLLLDLLGMRNIVIGERDVLSAALARCEAHGCQLADAIIFAQGEAAGCTRTLSFDRGARKAGMSLLA